MSIYMSYCAECGDKVEKVRVMSASGGPHYGYCQGCFTRESVTQYEIGPTWEQAARMRRKNNGRKAGERQRDNG